MTLEDFIAKYQKVPVQEYPNNVLQEVPVPLVSCRVSTYQHANYIRQCLDGILMQKTNFPFEIVIGEDESDDGTREICIEYASRHPNIIRLFLHRRENNILIDGRPTPKFQGTYTMLKCRGKYHAFCEGDDYWTDPNKLQKQVDFLEKNPDYGLVHTDYDRFNQKTGHLINSFNKFRGLVITQGEVYEEMLKLNFVALFTSMYRSHLHPKSELTEMHSKIKIGFGDYPLLLFLSKKGKFGYIAESTVVYRELENSASHFGNNRQKYFEMADGVYRLRFFMMGKYGCSIETESKLKKEFLFYELHKYFTNHDMMKLKEVIASNKIILKKSETLLFKLYDICSISNFYYSIIGPFLKLFKTWNRNGKR